MARIMIKCPETDRPVYTHLSCSWNEFDGLEIKAQLLRCPECHNSHAWAKENAFLEDEGGGD